MKKEIRWASPLVLSVLLVDDATFEFAVLCQGRIVLRRPIPRWLGVIAGGVIDQIGLTSQQVAHHRAQVERAKRAN